MPRGKKCCPSCNQFIGARSSSCICGYVFKNTEPKKKLNKFKILSRLVDIPDKNKKIFYLKEFKLMKILTERYSLEFVSIIDFGKKFDSLAYLVSSKLKGTLDQKWRAFNYKVDKSKYVEYNIGEKFGEDKIIKSRNKNTKDFLNE